MGTSPQMGCFQVQPPYAWPSDSPLHMPPRRLLPLTVTLDLVGL